MKKTFYSLLITIQMAILFSCCKPEPSWINGNKPPKALAGPDQVITLPTDSVSLDGSASNDPDGTISEWLWKKISGPASFQIVNPSTAKTAVKNLDTGVYRFELKVIDNENLSATDTVQITVTDPRPPNRPPIANAGGDQTITFPTNTVNLDGSASTDPDNNISSYLWTKISGPSSFSISNPFAVQTQVTNLVQGIYQFELRVSDVGGLFSKDTIRVNMQFIPTDISCPPTNRPIVSTEVIPIGNLSIARVRLATVAAGNKIFFAGGYSITGATSRVDIYDITSQNWSTAELSIPRADVSGVASADKIFFAGGFENSNNASGRVDIYDLTTGLWSIADLSQPRFEIVTASVGSKVFFAGGRNSDGCCGANQVSDRIDIYDLSTDIWSTSNLSELRLGFTATTAGSKVYFAGGWNINSGFTSSKIDIYDNNTGTWSTSLLNTPKGYHASIFHGGKIYWAGGATYIDDPWIGSNAYTCQVEIRDINSPVTTLMNLTIPSAYMNGSRAFEGGNKICFVSFYYQSWYLDIYDVSTNEWSIGILNSQFSFWPGCFISHGNTVYFAGGAQNNGTGGNIYVSQVWKLEF